MPQHKIEERNEKSLVPDTVNSQRITLTYGKILLSDHYDFELLTILMVTHEITTYILNIEYRIGENNHFCLLTYEFLICFIFQKFKLVIQFQISTLTKKMNKLLCFVLIFYLKISEALIKDEIHDDSSFVLPGEDDIKLENNKIYFQFG
jgi:hypothetical protein